MTSVAELREKFRSRFQSECEVFRAPGRVNLIGEHTDYNEGFVFPAAIGYFCWVAISARQDRKLVAYSENFDEVREASLDAMPDRSSGGWFDYPLGVARALDRGGKRLRGANLYFVGEVPFGAGLSSSAAVEVATGFALLRASGLPVDLRELALAAQGAENEFVGAHCGIMDQFVSCFGLTGNALLLDCRSLAFDLVPIPAGVDLVVCNTMVKHSVGGGEYNARRSECEEAVRRLRTALPAVRALRDVSVADLERHDGLLDATLLKRVRHVVTENARVHQFATALRGGDWKAAGDSMAASHKSLREDYEVSCAELNLMVELAVVLPGCRGARMTGAGFGGCTINFVDGESSAAFCRAIADRYSAKTGVCPDAYICEAANGVEKVIESAASSNVVRSARKP